MAGISTYHPFDDYSGRSAIPTETQSPTFGDWGKQLGGALYGVGSDLAYGLSDIGERIGDPAMAGLSSSNAGYAADQEQALRESMTPAGKQAATTWEHPASALPMRILGMLPIAAATLLPSGFIEDAALGLSAMGGVGALQGAGDYSKALHEYVKTAPDDQLRTARYYDDLRNMGMSEAHARDMYANHMATQDGYDAASALAGALMAVGGGPAQLVRGTAAGGALSEAARHGAEAAGVGVVGAAVPALAEAQTLPQMGDQSEHDVLAPIAESGIMGGVMGAAAGGARGAYGHGSKGKKGEYKQPKEPGATSESKVEVVGDKAPDAAETAALEAKQPAPTEPPPAAAPTPPPPTPPEPPAGSAVDPTPPPQGKPSSPPGAPPVSAGEGATDATVPVAPATTQPSLDKLTNGEVAAVVFKPGEEIPKKPKGFGQYKFGTDVYFFDPSKLDPKAIRAAVKDGTIGQHLGLTDVSKDEALGRAAQGETPVGVVEQTADGTEVKAAAGTDQTAPSQAAQMEAAKTPGNEVVVKDPQAVIAQREAQTPQPALVPAAPVKAPKAAKAKAVSKAKEAAKEPPAEAPAPAPAPITPEMRQAAEEAAARLNAKIAATPESKVPAPALVPKGEAPKPKEAPRVLADVSDEGVAKGVAQTEAQDAKFAKEQAERERIAAQQQRDEQPVGSKRSKRELAQRQYLNEAAIKIVADHPMLPGEENHRANEQSRVAMDARSRSMADRMDEAVKKWNDENPPANSKEKPLKSPWAIRDNTNAEQDFNSSVALIKRAKGLDQSVKSKRSIAKEDRDLLIASDRLARTNDPADRKLLLETIRQLNDENFRRQKTGKGKGEAVAKEPEDTPEGNIEEAGEAPPHPTDDARGDDAEAGGGGIADTRAHDAEDQMLGQLDQEDEPEAHLPPPKLVAEEPDKDEHYFSEVRALVRKDGKAQEGDVSVGPGGVPAPFDEVVKVAERGIADGTIRPNWVQIQRVLDIYPKDAMRVLEAVKAVAPEGDEPAVTGYASRTAPVVEKRRGRGPVGRPVSKEIPVSASVKRMAVGDDWTIPVADEAHTLPVTSSGKMGDVFADVPKDKDPFVNELVRKLTAQISDMDVHYVEQPHIDDLYPDRKVYGFFDPHNNHIVLSTTIPRDMETHVVLHEALHGALYDRIKNDPKALVQVKKLMNEYQKLYPDKSAYALTDEHEFVSEVLANPAIRQQAVHSPISSRLANDLGLFGRTARNLWNGTLEIFRRILGYPADYRSVLDGVVSLSERLALGEKRPPAKREIGGKLRAINADARSEAHAAPETIKRQSELLSKVGDQVKSHLADSGSDLKEKWRKNAPALLSNDQFRQGVEHLWGKLNESNPVRRLVDGIEKANTYMKSLLKPAEKLGNSLALARVKYRGDDWDKFVDLMHQSTKAGVHPDEPIDSGRNSHLRLAKNSKRDEAGGNYANWIARAAHGPLSEAYRALPEELQALYKKSRDFYSADRDGRVREAVGSIVDAMPEAPTHATREEIADRVFKGEMTDDDQAYLDKFEKAGKLLKNAKDVQKLKGPYVPLKRQGDYVVRGEHEIATPAGATREGNEFTFDTREEAHKFATSTPQARTIGKAYFDPETGERVKTRVEGVSTAGTPTEKYTVSVEPGHVEFAKTQREADAIHDALKEQGLKNVKHVDMKEKNANVDNSMHSSQLNLLTQAIKRREGLSDSEKAHLIDTLKDASLGMQKGNRIEQHYITRKGVSGESRDVLTNLADYSHASAAFRSRAAFRGEIDGALKDMRDGIGDDEHTVERRRALQEYEKRLMGFGSPEYTSKLGPFWQRMMTVSFVARMMSPAHLSLHLAHPVITSMPVAAGKYGVVNTYREFAKAYKDMGAGGALAMAPGGAKRVAKGGEATNFGEYFRNKMKGAKDGDELRKMFDELEARGDLHADSGFDVSRYKESQSGFDRGLRRVDETFREFTSATESVNRYATAIAGYRLAIKHGLGEVEAIRATKDLLANTQGLYSATNAAPLFRGGWKPFLQFKSYSQMVIHLMARLTHDAFQHEDKATRQAALRSFGMLIGTAATLTGFSGLPTDAAKVTFMLGNALGVTPNWEEAEDDLRRTLAHHVGPDLAKLAMTGVMGMSPAGVSAGHRLGLGGTLAPFGEPSGTKSQDLLDYITRSALGAPGSLAKDWIDAAQALAKGDLVEAAQKGIPVKAIDDAIKAAKLLSEGKSDKRGRQWMAPTGALPAAMQAFGFVPQTTKDVGTARHLGFAYDKQRRDDETAAKDAKHPPGWKGKQILGIAQNKKNKALLRDMADTYGATP